MTKRRKRLRIAEDRESLAWLGLLGTGFLGYFTAELGLGGQPHPLHWVVAAGAGLAGFTGGQLGPTVYAMVTRARSARRAPRTKS